MEYEPKVPKRSHDRANGISMARVEACSSVLSMIRASSDNLDRKIMLSISQIFQSLPMDTVMSPLNESEFITRYMLPIFQPLFDDDQRLTTIRCGYPKSTGTGNRPDCIISIMQGSYHLGNLRYGEIKSPLETGNHFGTNIDLLRLGLYCKNAIDDNKLGASLAIHVTGFMVVIYLLQLQADGIYLITKLEHIQFPTSIEDVPAFLTNATKLKNALHVFESQCIPVSDPAAASSAARQKRTTASASDMDMILKNTTCRKRRNVASHFPN
ncbi:hypothetical protein G6F21_004406 [Rhizopus arrhizus]|nr:hypothetical protein G6F23_003585 [Rhizopus arrhizus]KAG0766598.1 hypothetical protein G6F24_003476 [Rhizopus arrhizus]KAG0792370.1 hypothetical protein G6F21_004406 [Rhizopus arrhizus]KAG0813706.1 hypothetical protein G6F20_005356 [Rhizopus arrhizus]KAG0898848.1 hypothetical protein G6F34_005248 [Rhizopus arrhizus]